MNENTVYSPGGDIVASMVEGAKREIKGLVASSSGDFTMDFTNVEMIDSKGLSLIIATCNSLESAGRKLRIVGAIPDVVELFRLMRLDQRFVIA
jgi:anti-anti-sigma factor